jgi:Tat protein translocase TatC
MAKTSQHSETTDETDMATMSLGEHLEELRARLIRCLLAVAAAFGGCWLVRYQLMALLSRPHVTAMAAYGREGSLNYAGYWDPLAAQLKTCLIVAIILTAPYLIYQIWAFVAPGLFPHERRKVVRLGMPSVVCFAAGVCFGYFLFIPIALRYMLSLAGPGTQPMLMIDRYLSLFYMLTLALAVAFQTPVVVAYLVRWGVLDVESLQRHRKPFILIAFIVAAVLTPPDPLTQLMMGITLVVLYDLGGVIAAPSWATVKGFLRFAGLIVLVVGGVSVWHALRPVVRVTPLRGAVAMGERRVDAGEEVNVRQNVECRVSADGLAQFSFGGEDGGTVYLLAGARLAAPAPSKAVLRSGMCLAVAADRDPGLELHAGPAVAVVRDARAEFALADSDTLTVTVFQGEVTLDVQGVEQLVRAGRKQTFYRGGRPADTSEAAKKWEDLLSSPE